MRAGVVDAYVGHAAHVIEVAGLPDEMGNARPQLLVATPQQRRGLAHRQTTAKRERQRFKQGGEARTFARPGHAGLAGLAAARACNAGHIGVQPGFKLEEVQVPPGAAKPIMDALVSSTALRAGQGPGRAAHLEIDSALRRVEFNLGHFPRRNQPQRAGEQRLYANAHANPDLMTSIPPHGHVGKPLRRLAHMPTGTDYQRPL